MARHPHLRVERWFDSMSTGNLRRKRVSAAREKQFPLELRQLYQTQGAVKLVKHIMIRDKVPLAQAWIAVKTMFNA